MGVKAVFMCLLILGVVVAEIEGKSCCQSTTGRTLYTVCRGTGVQEQLCASSCGCIIVRGSPCPSSHPNGMLESSASASDYCKIGCTASVCDTIISGLNSGVGEGEAKEAVKHCKNACHELCNNGHKVELANIDV